MPLGLWSQVHKLKANQNRPLEAMMKTSKIALTIALPVAITVLASLVLTRSNATAANSDGQHLEGSWIVTAHVTDNPDLLIKALLTCTQNGEVVETPSVPLAVSTGHGVGV